jgi:hypothetical protein
LQAVAFRKRLLHRMQFAVFGKPFDSDNFAAFGHWRKHGAGFRGAIIQQDCAGATIRGVTANVSAGKVQVLAQQFHEKSPWLDQRLARLAVNTHTD